MGDVVTITHSQPQPISRVKSDIKAAITAYDQQHGIKVTDSVLNNQYNIMSNNKGVSWNNPGAQQHVSLDTTSLDKIPKTYYDQKWVQTDHTGFLAQG